MSSKAGRPHSGRMIRERVHDPYRARENPPEPAACTGCGAVYRRGRWQWDVRPADAHDALCQACRRIADRYPAGVVTLEGQFVARHKDEILSLARHQEEQEKAQHPLHRIMGIEEAPDRVVITTTDIHLPRRIGDAVRRAYSGDLALHYPQEAYFLRVNWTREK